mgnify:CR=1 FL=1
MSYWHVRENNVNKEMFKNVLVIIFMLLSIIFRTKWIKKEMKKRNEKKKWIKNVEPQKLQIHIQLNTAIRLRQLNKFHTGFNIYSQKEFMINVWSSE